MTGCLRHDNRATDAQLRFTFPPEINRPTAQADVILRLLREARDQGRALTLTQILQVGIKQYPARMYELRKWGCKIKNEIRRSQEGRPLSMYRLTFDPERDGAR